MNHKDAKSIAVENLTKDATLDELREAVRDLRTLSPDSALADLVEAKIERVLADRKRRVEMENDVNGRVKLRVTIPAP